MDEDVNRSANIGIILSCYAGSGDGIEKFISFQPSCATQDFVDLYLFQADLIWTIHLFQLWKLFLFFFSPFFLAFLKLFLVLIYAFFLSRGK